MDTQTVLLKLTLTERWLQLFIGCTVASAGLDDRSLHSLARVISFEPVTPSIQSSSV